MKTKALKILLFAAALLVVVVINFVGFSLVDALKEKPDQTDLIEFVFGDANDVTIKYDGPNYYHPFDLRAYTCPKCYEGASGDLCPGHYEPE